MKTVISLSAKSDMPKVEQLGYGIFSVRDKKNVLGLDERDAGALLSKDFDALSEKAKKFIKGAEKLYASDSYTGGGHSAFDGFLYKEKPTRVGNIEDWRELESSESLKVSSLFLVFSLNS